MGWATDNPAADQSASGIVQLGSPVRVGTAAQIAAYTGRIGELSFTSDTGILYIHDGSTQGGTALSSTAYVDAAESDANDYADSVINTNNEIYYVRDEKTVGSQGGGMTQGVWHSRTLNTEVIAGISGASLASDTVTLPAGTYKIVARCPGLGVNTHKCRLYNSTDESVELIGSNAWNVNTNSEQTDSNLRGVITLSAEKDLKLQHICGSTNATNGFGSSNSFSSHVEVYAELWIEKITAIS